jgi:hypothetical protein
MKKLIPLMLLLLVFTAKAQNFEGTIKWSMKMEITDPAMKAKMEAAQQRAADPAQKAKMEKMEAQMNDPKMKAMMESNPQMKAQMEAMMKMAQSGDMNSMMPKGMIIRVKGQNTLMKMDGGPMAMELLYLRDKDVSYNLNRENKTYSTMPKGDNTQRTTNPAKVTKTSETAKILSSSIWTTTEIKDIDMKNLGKQRMGRGQSMYYEGMEGVPLKIESSTGEGKMIMEVTEIKRESQNASDFTLPTDFKETQGMFGRP